MRRRATVLTTTAILLTFALHAAPARKRALLVAINDYTAAQLPPPKGDPPPARDWSNLDGTINDVELMRALIVERRAFHERDVEMLVNHEATRNAILRALARLAAASRTNDIVFVYYSGHGSQVVNSLSSEDDKLDESLVPADSRHGALDIRDKELRDAFNRILDRGARLTVIIDACHSGSGARGLDGGVRARVVTTDPRDVRDGSTGPQPEDRGAVIISAAQDFDQAFETRDRDGKIRGAFTWAFAQALRAGDDAEPLTDTFLHAQVRLRADRPGQDAVLAGPRSARLIPFLGDGVTRAPRRHPLSIEQLGPDGTYVLHGGWTSGITVGSELRIAGNDEVRLKVTTLLGISRAEACAIGNTVRRTLLQPGTLLEIAAWAPPPSRPLRVWIPIASQDVLSFAERLRERAAERAVTWIEDPTETTPEHLVRYDKTWQLIRGGHATRVDDTSLDVMNGGELFVQLPAFEELAEEIGNVDGVEQMSGPRDADYILAGRLTSKGIEYAWIRPQACANDTVRSTLPARTQWTDNADILRQALLRLQRVHGWHELEAPAGGDFAYHLGIRRAGDDVLIEDGTLIGERGHYLVLRARGKSSAPVFTRHLYAFMIDSYGRSVLLFPRVDMGDVENRLPVTQEAARPIPHPPYEIPLAPARPFTITEPYGLDTYFLLTTEEKLPGFESLEADGVRSIDGVKAPLERLLDQTLFGTRGDSEPIRTPVNWSIEKVTFESVAPRSIP